MNEMKNGRTSLIFALAIIINIGDTYSQKPRLGGSVNVYHRYGHLAETMRVMPIDDHTPWSFRERSINVVENPVPKPKNKNVQSILRLFSGNIQMEFCDSVQQLLKSYFREFQFEGMNEPWHAFTANWSNEAIAEHFGINVTYVGKDYSYVLLKYARFHNNQKLADSPDSVEPTITIAEEIEKMNYSDAFDLIGFFRNYGTHYISSYTTGNALYQVFVYENPYYGVLREDIKTRGLFQIPLYELSIYFSPFYAVQVSSIKSTSGNHSLDAWITEKLRGRYTKFAYTSLMKMHRNPRLIEELGGVLQDEALLRLQLRSMAHFFKDPAKREWFEGWLSVAITEPETLQEDFFPTRLQLNIELLNLRLMKKTLHTLLLKDRDSR